MILGEREQQVDRKIALSNIESIEVDSINWLTTSLLVLGIGAVIFIVAAAIVVSNINIK